MNFPTEVVTPKEIAHYLLFTRWHHFWGQIRTWDKSEKNQAEAELADALESYAESFRAETEERAANRMLDMIRGSLEGYPHAGGDIAIMTAVEHIRAETLARAAEVSMREQNNEFPSPAAHILALGSDPSWLARQIAAAKLEEAKWWEHLVDAKCSLALLNDEECIYCARIAALSATKLGSWEPQQQPEEMK